VLPVMDETREEEVLACIVLKEGKPGDAARAAAIARELFDACYRTLAYHKAPGWIYFLDELPTTGTLKILKHMIFPAGTDPRRLPGMLDFRDIKIRPRETSSKA
jgi:acyl-coenzyme A synthetase/AMP-(fatty) acid ligase